MKWLTLPIIKNQLRLEPDYNDEDTMLELYGNSAEEVVMEYIRRDYDEIIEKYKSVPANLVHDSIYIAQRDTITQTEIREVERELSGWQWFQIWAGRIALIIAAAFLVWLIIKQKISLGF